MTVHELSREQLTELKCSYMTKLADEGSFAEVMDTDHDEPSCLDIANADSLVPDDVIYREYEDTLFTEDDFISV